MRWTSIVAILCTAMILAAPPVVDAQLFLPKVDYPTGDLPTTTATGDLNEDGNLDVVVANHYSWTVSVLLGNGDGTLQPPVSYTSSAGPHGVAVAHLNSDHHLDVVAACYGGTLSVFLGNGDGTLTPRADYDSGWGPVDVASDDLDGDGDQDLVVANINGGNLFVHTGSGDGTFPTYDYYTAYDKPRRVVTGDLNNDGILDLVAPSEDGGQLSMLFGYGDGTFAPALYWSCGGLPFAAALAHFNDDGNLDVTIANRANGTAILLMGNGDGSFYGYVELSAGGGTSFVGASDLDGDGLADIWTANTFDDNVSFIKGHGDGSFAYRENYAAGTDPFHASACDLDLDGDRDLVVANQIDGTVSVLLNTSGVPVEPTITRVEDVAGDQGRQVRLEWLRSRHDAVGDTVGISGYELYRYEHGRLEDWDYVATVPAHTDSIYQYVAPTLCDSTVADGYCPSTFMVRATTAVPWIYFDSAPATGYSVDNLAPGVPEGLVVAYHSPGGTDLSWDECGDDDFQYFKIYRGDSEEFVPAPENLVHMTVDPLWTDPSGSGWDHYKVSAVDHAGNESAAGSPEAVTGVGEVIPKAHALSHSFPNPFNPVTHIAYHIPEPGCAVELRVFDSAGHVVETLVDSWMPPGRYTVTWNGTDGEGRELGSGVYFCVMDAPGFSERRKMVLLK